MRAVLSLVLVGLLCLRAAHVQAENERTALQTPKSVEGLQLDDIDRDGLVDVLVLEGRTLRIYRGRKGALPKATPTWTGSIPDHVSFVDVAPREAGQPPALVTYGKKGVERLPVLGDGAPTAIEGGEALPWSDSKRVVFADLVHERGLLLPRTDGVTLRPFGTDRPVTMKLQRVHAVKAPGPFLEDTCEVTVALPPVVIGLDGTPRGRSDIPLGIWAIDGQQLVARSLATEVRWDLSFLGAEDGGKETEQTIVDLDDDDHPDLIHRIYTNRDSRYGFFRTKLPPKNAKQGALGPSHKPAVSDIYLSGYQLPLELVDLDGDGLEDLVITSIQVNAANTLRALSSGEVSAETRAFLNRSRKPGFKFFRSQADALVKSDILVKVRFNYAGTVEVERSFTILLDGDFNGDGRKDLAIRTGPQAMTVRHGAAAGVWEEKGYELPIPPIGDAPDVDGYTADLDGDGKDEIVLLYRGPPGGNDTLWVVRASP